MKILITGGAGYIGSVLVPTLLQKGYDVKVLDNFMYGGNFLADACRYRSFSVLRGDVRNKALMEDLVRSVDLIIPLAALVGAPLCKRDPITASAVNQKSIEELCRMLSVEQRILMPVTNSGYGIGARDNYCTEDSPLRPISLYGTTKVEAEKAVLERENSITFRLATVFGMSPRMRLDLLVNDFVHRAVNDKALVIFEGHFKRNYIHVRDVANAFLHGIDNFEIMRGKPYNVGLDSANLTKLQLAEAIKLRIPDFTYVEAEIGEDPDKRDYIVSNARIASTGFAPEWTLDDGIVELIKGYTTLNNSRYGNL